MSLNDLAVECYHNARERGFHDKPRRFGEDLVLIHSEVSEALEEYRNSNLSEQDAPNDPAVVEEFADMLIRIFDTAGKYGYNLDAAVAVKMERNRNRSYRHGGKNL